MSRAGAFEGFRDRPNRTPPFHVRRLAPSSPAFPMTGGSPGGLNFPSTGMPSSGMSTSTPSAALTRLWPGQPGGRPYPAANLRRTQRLLPWPERRTRWQWWGGAIASAACLFASAFAIGVDCRCCIWSAPGHARGRPTRCCDTRFRLRASAGRRRHAARSARWTIAAFHIRSAPQCSTGDPGVRPSACTISATCGAICSCFTTGGSAATRRRRLGCRCGRRGCGCRSSLVGAGSLVGRRISTGLRAHARIAAVRRDRLVRRSVQDAVGAAVRRGRAAKAPATSRPGSSCRARCGCCSPIPVCPTRSGPAGSPGSTPP